MRATFYEPWTRRRFLGAGAALSAWVHGRAAPAAEGGAGALESRELHLDGDPKLARSALLLTPRVVREGQRFPVLVLLHGLAETQSEELGLHAWSERYGLVDADARLRHPPVTCANPRRYLPASRAARIDGALAARPYGGCILVCPVTPNVYNLPPPDVALDRYATWIERTLLPAVHATTPSRTDAASTAIDGCSLGGYVALEVFLRKPETFGVLGGVQTAIGEASARAHADRLAEAIRRVGPRALHIESSLWDPSMKAHTAMSARLHELGIAHDFDVLPGGHDQIFLREVGTLEMLLWHDRVMNA